MFNLNNSERRLQGSLSCSFRAGEVQDTFANSPGPCNILDMCGSQGSKGSMKKERTYNPKVGEALANWVQAKPGTDKQTLGCSKIQYG
jgi:hypothetical protein